MLSAFERIVVDVEVALFERLDWEQLGAGTKCSGHRAELHGNKFCLGDDVAVAVQQRGRGVARFAHDGRVGRANELGPHFARRGDQSLADDRVIDGIEHVAAVVWRRVRHVAIPFSRSGSPARRPRRTSRGE